MITYRSSWWFLIPAMLYVAGCSGSSGMAEVQGFATLDGKPIEDGSIRFIPLDGKSPTAGAAIKAGEFQTRVAINKHRVLISSPKIPTGVASKGRFNDNEDYIVAELVPEKYNTKSELVLEVKEGLNTPRYDLQSQ